MPVEGLHLSAFGAVIHARGARRLSYGRELIVTLAGCGMNLVCGFLTALLTGDRSGLSRQTRNELSIAGIYHAVAVSGMHVSILLGMVLLLCGGVSGAPLSPEEGGPSPDAVWRNDFSDPENLGKEWKFAGSRFMVPRTNFRIAEEASAVNGRVMVVEAKRSTGVMLAAPSPVDLERYPVMRWRWRVIRPVRLAPEAEEVDDQAVVLYFGDGTLIRQKSVGYRWECNTPIGSSALLKYAAGMMTVKAFCVRNRTSPVGEWITEERDVVADFRAAYGRNPNRYFIISVGANSQYSDSDTRAEIDFIEFVPRRKPPEGGDGAK